MTKEVAEKIVRGITDKIECNTVDIDDWAEFWGFTREEYEEFLDMAVKALEQQPCYNPDEWCHDCSEYDHDKHCCPRYNKVIRNAVEEVKKPKTGHWILTDDDFVYCSECEDSYYPRPIDASWYYCPHCGAKMIEPQAESEGTDAGSN